MKDVKKPAEETITITRKEYDELIHDSKVLNALYAGGVDNWEWYGESLSNMEDEENK